LKKSIKKLRLEFKKDHSIVELLGERDSFLKEIEKKFKVDIFVLGNDVEISGEKKKVEEAAVLINELVLQINIGQKLNSEKLGDSIHIMESKSILKPHEIFDNFIIVNSGKKIKARTEGQKRYIEAIKENTIVFSIGPAGTGKTYLALAMAVNALKSNEVGRIVLVKPVVEAGEKLGFLPGDLYDKINPFLKPLYDGLYEMLDIEIFQQYMEMNIIEVIPLAYMRGRTLNDSFIILDEAQNTSPEQMKMFLTRLGFGSRVVITGDITQIDLPEGKQSGLILVNNILKDIDGIEFIYLTADDVVRHNLVQKIVNAYKAYEDEAINKPKVKETEKKED
jgi:phosphate starvation-inducible protein PhoH and related proteins